jgi:predicted nucleic acid-binding protein
MKVLFDTSVLVASIVSSHTRHARALLWLKRARAGKVEMLVSTHSIAELYAVLTALPVTPRIPPGLAARLIADDVERNGTIVALSASDYRAVLTRMVDVGLTGGAIYDALILRAAEKSKVEKLLTLNPEDFKRAWPECADRVIAP